MQTALSSSAALSMQTKPLPALSSSAALFSRAFFGSDAVRIIDLGSDCWLLHGKLPAALMPSEEERAELWASQPVSRETFQMYGRSVAVPRLIRLYSQHALTVSVAGGTFEAVQLERGHPKFLERLLVGVPTCGYNAVVANWYEDGSQHIGWHGDKEPQIDADSAPIVSVSIGAERRFQVRHEGSRNYVFTELLTDGDCVVMGGPNFHHKFKHRVPKMLAKKDGPVAARINLTVRKYIGKPIKPPSTKRINKANIMSRSKC